MTGSTKNAAHVVILMRESRGFDYCLGTLCGVRGFGDRHPIPLAPMAGQTCPMVLDITFRASWNKAARNTSLARGQNATDPESAHTLTYALFVKPSFIKVW